MIFLILFSGLIIRLISLNQSLWLDEATSALVARMPLVDIFTKFLPGDFHPPLYYLILKHWVLFFGSSEMALRIPSVIFGVATVYLVYLIGKKVSGSQVGLIAAILLATSGLGIYYSQEARMYSLAAFLVSLSVYLFLRKKWAFFSIVLAIIGLTDYVSLLIVPVFWLVSWGKWKKLAVSHLPLVIMFTVWLPIFVKQLAGGFSQAGGAWWNILGVPTFKNIALIPVKFILGRISFDNKWLYGFVVVGVITVFGYLLSRARKTQRILWYWLVVPIAIGMLVSFEIPTLSYFRFLFCLPAFYVLSATGITKTGKYANIFFGLVLTVNILSAGYYLLNPKFQREDWRAAAKAVGSNKVVFPSGSQKEALSYYGKGSQIVRATELEAGDNEIWLSRYVWEIVDPADSTRLRIQDLGYNKLTEYNFNGVVFWKYSKNQYASRD